jgi:hypothetical protein
LSKAVFTAKAQRKAKKGKDKTGDDHAGDGLNFYTAYQPKPFPYLSFLAFLCDLCAFAVK